MQSPRSFKELIATLKRIVEAVHRQIAQLEQAPHPNEILIAKRRAALARLEADLKLFSNPNI